MNEMELGRINQGKLASLASGHMSPLFISRRAAALSKLKADYRTNALTWETARSLIAELVVLDDLESALRGQILTGERTLNITNKEGT